MEKKVRQRFLIQNMTACLVALLTFSCSPKAGSSSIQGLSADPNSRNIALIFSNPADLPYVVHNVAMINGMLSDANSHYNFEVHEFTDYTADQIVEATAQYAPQVSDGGTLFWYFTGHGAADGRLAAGNNPAGRLTMLNFDTVSQRIKSVRTTPLKRLVVIAQACYSGNLVNGATAVGRDDVPVSLWENEDSLDSNAAALADQTLLGLTGQSRYSSSHQTGVREQSSRLFDQLLVMAASEKEKVSLGFPGRGSAFTLALSQTFASLRNQPGATLGQLATQASQRTGELTQGADRHHGQFRAYPSDEILNEPLVNGPAAPVDLAPIPNPQPSPSPLPAPLASDLFVALTRVSDTSAALRISGNLTIQRIIFCEGSESTCLANPVAALSVSDSGTVVGVRKIFRADAALFLDENKTYTVIGYANTSQPPTLARSLRFKRVP